MMTDDRVGVEQRVKNNIFKSFIDFLTRGNVVDLAVGVIIGGAFTRVISSFANDVIMPLAGMLLGQTNFSDLKWVISPATNTRPEVAVMYGNFIEAAVDFFIIALCIFFFIILIGRDPEKIKTKDEAQKEQGQKTIDLLEEIRDALKNSGGKSSSSQKSSSQKSGKNQSSSNPKQQGSSGS